MSRTVHVSVTRDTPPSRGSDPADFVRLCLAMARSKNSGDLALALEESPSPALRGIILKGDVLDLSSGAWGTSDAALLARTFLESVADDDLLQVLARSGARVIPGNQRRALLGVAVSAGAVDEMAVKPVQDMTPDLADVVLKKIAALVVLSAELEGETGIQLFARELSVAVLAAGNAAVLTALALTPTAISTTPIAAAQDALTAAEPSRSYILAGDHGVIAAIDSSGDFRPGRVSLVAVAGATSLTAIPVDRVTLFDGGLTARTARHANVDLSGGGTPAYSLWQRNAAAVQVERLYKVAIAEAAS